MWGGLLRLLKISGCAAYFPPVFYLDLPFQLSLGVEPTWWGRDAALPVPASLTTATHSGGSDILKGRGSNE